MSKYRWLRALFGLAITVPLAALGHGLTGYAAQAGARLTAAQVAQLGHGSYQSVIIELKNQHADLYGHVNTAARTSAIHADQAPVLSELSAVGAQKVTAYSLVNMIAAQVTSSEITHLRTDAAVQAVVPNLRVQRPQSVFKRDRTGTISTLGAKQQAGYPASTACTGTPNDPQLNPEALQVTNDAFDTPSTPAATHLVDGSGVLVASIADGLDPNQPDFQRLPGNPDYIKDGAHVITQYVDLTGNGLNGQTGGGEMFGDASSIAAQGNTAYDATQWLSPLPGPFAHCWIKIKGMAPGANVMALTTNFTFADIVLAIQYAVQHGANVINESFGSDQYPDVSTNPTDLANDAAIGQGVTVVQITGDSGSQSTLWQPGTDPNVINVGASTTFRVYTQLRLPDRFPGWNLNWQSNQLSALSSAGISYGGNSTVDVLAPGDLNWALCSDKLLAPSVPAFTECGGLNFELFGGTSESAPLTAGLAALIIQAYRQSHGGATPMPQIIKAIIKGTATNLDLPSDEQGAGLINALAAVKAAIAYNGPDGPGSSGPL
jgi:subtilisin family serine protease